jgi:cellulose biosynthesis protein BcsQ
VQKKLKASLERFGIEPWISGINLHGGDDYIDQIKRALSDCDWVLVVMSPRSAGSEWVQHEVHWAIENRPGRVLPVLMEPCDRGAFHSGLLAIQYVDFTQGATSDAVTGVIQAMLLRTNEERQKFRQTSEKHAETVARLELRRDQTQQEFDANQACIRTALEFDGNWSGPQRGRVAEFVPLEQRKTPIVSVFNLKGGVGKSMLTANLGATLWGPQHKKRVLVVDLDYQGSLTRTCLSPSRISRLRHGRDMSDKILRDNPPANLLAALAEPVVDEQSPEHKGKIIATDEELQIAESKSMLRWLLDPKGDDVRYRLRAALHVPEISAHDLVLLDCPPRLTTATINALLASDYVLVPTILDEVSAESVSRVLRWLAVRRDQMFPDLDLLGVICNMTKNILAEREVRDGLKASIVDAWGDGGRLFDASIPKFTAAAMSHDFPAHARDVRAKFEALAQQILRAMSKPTPARRR